MSTKARHVAPWVLAAVWLAGWVAESRGAFAPGDPTLRCGLLVGAGALVAIVSPRAAVLALLATTALWLVPGRCVTQRPSHDVVIHGCYQINHDTYGYVAGLYEPLYLLVIAAVIGGAALHWLVRSPPSRRLFRRSSPPAGV